MMYWTDRGDPPRGNTVNRAPMDRSRKRKAPEIVSAQLMEGIGCRWISKADVCS